ncbi:MAG: NAD(P)H-hydrate dehydratase [bacterium]|nr:NAD(P)H-hydrate dehydratase [bacterium]
MFAVYGSAIKNLDAIAFRKYLIPPELLMEDAAVAAANAMIFKWSFSSCSLVCGDGNNSGDGFALARHLSNRGIDATVILLGKKSRFSKITLLNFKILKKMKIKIFENPSAAKFKKLISESDVIADAIYGTGFRGELSKKMRPYFKAVNTSAKRVISLDVPSGLNCDTGESDRDCITADITVTFGAVKAGLLWNSAVGKSKELLIADISLPKEIILKEKNFIIAEKEILSLLAAHEKKAKEGWIHKSQRGRASFIGGNRGMEGSIQLASEAALKTGAGIVYTYMLSPAKKKFFPEIVFSLTLKEAMKQSKVWIAGCGMGTGDDALEALDCINKNRADSIVLYDADALNLISRMNEKKKKRFLKNSVITPHPKEFLRLSGKRFLNIKEKISCAEEFSRDYKSVVVLKSPPTIVTDSKTTIIFPNMSKKLATAGSGDVLSGIIGGLLARGFSPMTASSLGVFIHFYAGFYSASENPTASEFLKNISKPIKEVLNA